MFRFLFTILFLPLLLTAETGTTIKEANDLFDHANELSLKDPDMAKRKYKSAVLKYKKLIASGLKNPYIYTNLGNAYFFSGDKGRALLNYQRAYRLDPANKDLNHNIEFLRSQAVDVPPGSISKVLKYAFYWHKLDFNLKLSLFILFNCIFWAYLAWSLYKRKKSYSWIMYSSLILGLLLFGSILTTAMQWDNSIDGVVTEREVTPRQGNGYIYEMALSGPLHSGAEFTLLESRKKWYYIKLTGGSKCWIPKKSSTLIEE